MQILISPNPEFLISNPKSENQEQIAEILNTVGRTGIDIWEARNSSSLGETLDV